MSRRLIVHIGIAKSGTTTLQNQIFNKLEGIINIGRPNHLNNAYHDMQYAMVHGENEEEALRLAETYISSCVNNKTDKPIVWSDETLMLGEILSVFLSRLAKLKYDTTILVTLRNQKSLIESHYTNHGRQLKGVPNPWNGKFVHFDDYFQNVIVEKNGNLVRNNSLMTLFRHLNRFFECSKIKFIMFEDLAKSKDLFSSRLSSILGVQSDDIFNLINKKAENTRETARLHSYQKFRSRFLPNMSITRFLPFSSQIRHGFEKYLKRGDSYEVLWKDEQLNKIYEIFGEENRQFMTVSDLPLKDYGYPGTQVH